MRIFENENLIQRNFVSNPEIVLTEDMIRGSVSYCYETLDMIDYYLVSRGSGKLSRLLDKANLSSIIGNLLCSGLEQHSENHYRCNAPHTYPDLLAVDHDLPGIEVKTALRRNCPKGHHPKPGYYLTFRYCLTDENGLYHDEDNLCDTVTFWEIKFGYLNETDFCCSNTSGDSGKTAVINISSLNRMPLLYFDSKLVPYKHSSTKPYHGFN